MRRELRIKEGLVILCFLILGGCLLLSGTGLLADAGVRRERVDVAGKTCTLWYPAEASAEERLSDPEEEAHGHEQIPAGHAAALVLTDSFDGSRSLAAELARRGLTVLLAGENTPPAEAWAALSAVTGADHRSIALLAGPDRAEEALAFAGTLAENGQKCAALILLGNETVARSAGTYPGGNLLLLTRSEPGRVTAEAFFGSEAAAERGFDGLFGEGTARALSKDGAFGSFARRETLEHVIDWQGSALGHAVELADSDLIFEGPIKCCVGAAACLFLAAGSHLVLFRRRDKDEQ